MHVFYSTHDFTEEDSRQIEEILNRADGWSSALPRKITFRDVTRRPAWTERHDVKLAFRMYLESADEISRKFCRYSDEFCHTKLSVTIMTRAYPRAVYINASNWNEVPEPARPWYDLAKYRTYLINHEVGHAALNLGHDSRCRANGTAHIMHQHTKGPGECAALSPEVAGSLVRDTLDPELRSIAKYDVSCTGDCSLLRIELIVP